MTKHKHCWSGDPAVQPLLQGDTWSAAAKALKRCGKPNHGFRTNDSAKVDPQGPPCMHMVPNSGTYMWGKKRLDPHLGKFRQGVHSSEEPHPKLMQILSHIVVKFTVVTYT